MSHPVNQIRTDALPGLAQLLIALAAVDEAARPAFEARMRNEGVNDFTRASTGRYTDTLLQWRWEDWRVFTRAGVPT